LSIGPHSMGNEVPILLSPIRWHLNLPSLKASDRGSLPRAKALRQRFAGKKKNLRQPLGAPSRTPRELPNLPSFAIFANLFRPKKFPQVPENRAAGI
jgi:hypothetical protein